MDVRSEFRHGVRERFRKRRVAQETRRMYPHRRVLNGIEWPLVA